MNWILSNKNLKKCLILSGIGIGLCLIGYLSWVFFFSYYAVFQDQEDIFLEEVQRYYQYRPELLPKEGDTKEVTLAKLLSEKRIQGLYVPKTHKVCEDTSWVRVHNEGGEYEYFVYLKCGRYESKVDHEPPVIELNGEKEIILNHNQPYEEMGVKKVTDAVDGTLKTDKVEIDASNVDVTKPGVYQVTYKVRDSHYNQAVVTRTVNVRRNLTEIVKSSTDESHYFKGAVSNNYVIFSGMVFRIINVNEDGSVKVVSEDILSNLRYIGDSYEGSSVETWLNEVFYKRLHDADQYVVDTNFCVGDVASMTDFSGSCTETVKAKVGLLSVDEFQKTVLNQRSSTNYGNSFTSLLANRLVDGTSIGSHDWLYVKYDSSMIPPIKPVLTLKADMYVTEGNGTKETPYKLYDYEYGKEHDEIRTRLVGEYVNFSGQTFRINEIDQDGSVKLIGTKPLINNSTGSELQVKIDDIENYQYNLDDENNPGYILNEDFVEFLDEDNILTKKFQILTNDQSLPYDQFEKETVSARLFLASTVDLFSGANNNVETHKKTQLYSDHALGSDIAYQANTSNGVVYEIGTFNMSNLGLKVTLYINGSMKIKSGKGTEASPYII